MNRLCVKSDGTPLQKVVWEEKGWILRKCPPSYARVVVASHRHKIQRTADGGQECMLKTASYPGWVCRWCNQTAPEGMQALFYMMNWEKI